MQTTSGSTTAAGAAQPRRSRGGDRPSPPVCAGIEHSDTAARMAPAPSTGDEPVAGWRPWGVGGSDIGALLGLSPYRSAVDVWLEKVRPGAAKAADPALPMRFGSFLEPFVVREYESLTGNTAWPVPRALHHPEHPELFGHVDRMAKQAGVAPQEVVLECKTCSAYRAGEWGPAWSDQVPAEYLAQCLWYLGLAQCQEAHLAVLLGNSDFRVYRVRRDLGLERHMFGLAHRFWVDHVLTGRPPQPQTRAQSQSLYPRPTPGLSKEARADTVLALKRKAQLEQGLMQIQAEIEQIKDRVAAEMGQAERLDWRGQTLATWRLCKGAARLEAERLRRERPDIADSFTVQGPDTRRLQIKPGALNHHTKE